jgi:WhiB family redox-sensing transcriptional regulator
MSQPYRFTRFLAKSLLFTGAMRLSYGIGRRSLALALAARLRDQHWLLSQLIDTLPFSTQNGGPQMLEFRVAVSDDWMDFAACKGEDPKIFFSEGTPVMVNKAKEICFSCPVIEPCSQLAMTMHNGIWAGMTPRERSEMRRMGRS